MGKLFLFAEIEKRTGWIFTVTTDFTQVLEVHVTASQFLAGQHVLY